MASSIIHLAVTNELTKRHTFNDEGRLKFGAILPDAGKGKASHLNKYVWGFNRKAYDFELFRSKYGELMKTDDLYIGYYLHLVQDICYRHFVFDKYKWNPMIPGNVEKLHKDYSIINYYVVTQYGLSNDIEVPDKFEDELIASLCTYDIDGLMKSMADYFVPVPDDDIFFFTKEMADEYIAEAVELCLKELKALETGEGLIDSYDNAWDNKTYSLLETTLTTRDLGGYRIDGTERYTKYGRIIRSDVANYPSEKDISFLKNSSTTTIIDTRSTEEKERKPHGLANMEGFEYYDIPIEEGSGVPESVEAVPESYYQIAHAANIGEVFRTIANADSSVMFNCTAGKDRSGVISALLLWLCGVRKSDIVYDYMRTKENNKKRFEQIQQNFPDLDMKIVIPNENNMIKFMEMIEANHGTVQNYFTSIGITPDIQQKIIEKLCEG
ncbi:tyrosine-protein phosphatase [Butyrivibrio sp. LC3010]|uniref:tyrosine-protein phosphatase n=1 Tax=Butyrivibrio sp. LC3010 TaxID=1280680 RepID=UPI00042A3DB5|nr:tyrosine-protein phosphatase [Butyrivibrio sp. LC3010]